MDDLLQQGETAFKAGNRDEARKIFITVVKQSPNIETAWGWMYQVSNSDQEKIHCLKQILRINPKSEKAKQLLDTLDPSDFPFEALPNVIPLTNFQPTLQSPTRITPTNNIQNRFVGGLGLIAVLIVCVFAGGAIAYVYQAFSEIDNALKQGATQAPIQASTDYYDLYSSAMNRYFAVTGTIVDLIYNPPEFGSQLWINQLNNLTREMESVAIQISNLPPPPPEMDAADGWIRQIPSEIYAANEDIRNALRMQDYYFLLTADVHIQNADSFVDQSTEAMRMQLP